MIYECSDMMPLEDPEYLGDWIAYHYSVIRISDEMINDRNHCVSAMRYDSIRYRKSKWHGRHEIIISVENPCTGMIDKYYPSIDEFIDLMDHVRTKEMKEFPEKTDPINQSFFQLLDFIGKAVIPTPSDIMDTVHAAIEKKRETDLRFADPENNIWYYEPLADGSVCITGAEGNDPDGDLIIPAVINDHPVTKIGDGAFAESSFTGTMTIPEGTSEIGDAAFYNCSLFSLSVPKSVTKIGRFAFNWCRNLRVQVISGSFAETYCRNNGIPIKKDIP